MAREFDLLERGEAVARVLDLREGARDGRATERVAIDRIAGRVLAGAVVAEGDRPPADRATMDGFALDAADGYPLDLVEAEVYPEDDPPDLDAGEAVRVATGAPLPRRANAVLMREDATVEGGQLSGPPVDPGAHVYRRGSNVRAGETIVSGGERLAPRDAALLADLGVEAVEVTEPFSAGVLATGTEIHEGRSPDRDSAMLAGLVRSWGHDATLEGSVPDDYDRVEGGIAELAGRHDAVITAGGTSVGRKDHVLRALSALGEVEFRGVAVRPGRPVAAARLPDHDAVAFAVPGKPVAAHTAAALAVRPFFVGESPLPWVEAELARDVGVDATGIEYAVPVVLDGDEAMPMGHVDSPLSVYDATFDPSIVSQSTRAVRADGLFLARRSRRAGETVRVVPYESLE